MPVELRLPGSECGQWFLLHTRSRQEKALAADLASLNIANFLPLAIKTKRHGKRRVEVCEPIFPSYLFLRGSIDQAYQADRTDRVARIIPVPDQTQLDTELKNIALALSHDARLDPYPFIQEGTRVEVRSGPFEGMQGIVEKRMGNQRLILAVHMLGQAVALDITGEILEPIDS